MPAPRKIVAAGNKFWFLAFLDSNAWLLGGDTSAPAQGATGSGMYNILGIQTAAPTTGEPDIVVIEGDDTSLAEIPFDSIAARSFEVLVAIHDTTIVSRLNGTTPETVGEIEFSTRDTDNTPDLDVCMIFQSRARKQDAGLKGKKAWAGTLVPLAIARYLGRQAFGGREAAAFRFQISPQLASYDPTGVTYASPVLPAGATGLRYRDFTSEYPITMHAHRGTGALSTFTLDQKPISAAKTKTIVRRVPVTTSSVSTSLPYSTTLSAAPAAGSEMASVYEFDG